MVNSSRKETDPVQQEDLQDLCGRAIPVGVSLVGISPAQETQVYTAAQGKTVGSEFSRETAEARAILNKAGIDRTNYKDSQCVFLLTLIVARQSYRLKHDKPGWSVVGMQGLVFSEAQSVGRSEAMRVLQDVLALS